MLAILASAALMAGSSNFTPPASVAASRADPPPAVIVQAGDPGQQINRGIVLARVGQTAAARRLFEAARDNRDWIDLQIPSGDWIDSRRLARRALAMLKRGDFTARGQIALR